MVDKNVEDSKTSTKLNEWNDLVDLLFKATLSTNQIVVHSLLNALRFEYKHLPSMPLSSVNEDTDNQDQLEIVKVSSTPNISHNSFSSVESSSYLPEELVSKEQQYKQTVSKIESKLLLALKDFSIESEKMSYAESLIYEYSKQYTLRLVGEALTDIYIKCYDQPKVIAGICSSLERFDASEVSPWGQSIVIGLVNHNNDYVKERVISLIENWGDSSLLPALKSIDIKSKWMQEYVDDVVEYLEEKNALFEKTIK